MSDQSDRRPGGNGHEDPWAPPGHRTPRDGVDWSKRGGTGGGTPQSGPPGAHDQPTVTSVPGVDPFAAPGAGAGDGGGAVPPPPIAPGGPGQTAPGPYGHPAGVPGGSFGTPAGWPYGGHTGYPGHSGYGAGGWAPAPANGMGITALVLGIIAVAGFCLYGLGIVLGVLALVFGFIGRARARRGEADNGGMALAGIILGAVGVVVGAAFLGLLAWAVVNDPDFGEGSEEDPWSASLTVATAAR
ncbi:DUF4190 domain-containing protein [Streptomyces spongiicola]|uniref:DUF4190 domain-containing protein n=1 Tax=Streptomyces spongiicola TaxID=1690221 RepID=A0A2S1Z4Y2_9ACTN|nr:DUF4190 domain-containing protein [Streptomyces spongiicola]AWK11439.1 hypothetical protein DDQ41_23840 [Streptomyces spongiicola]GBQ01454.1 DUF4190 domain-containing protein [Streptomyces spongiicola]